MRGAPLLLVLAAVLAGCLSADAPEGEAPAPSAPLIAPDEAPEATRQTLRWALPQPSEVVPPLAGSPSALQVADALFDALTRVENGEPVPAAADAWRSNRDGSMWTFRLRAGATFHDGTPVTAEDFRHSWEEGVRRGRLPPLLEDVRGYEDLRAGASDHLDGLRVAGERTLQVFLDGPRADLAAVVSHPALGPVPASAWERDERALRSRPVGNGPFEVTEEWAGGSFVRARRFDDWANGDPPTFEEMLFRFTDAATGFVAFQQSRVDIAEVPLGGMEAALERFGELDEAVAPGGVVRDPAAELYVLAMDMTAPPFDDPAVRRALSLALDRQRIIARLPDGNAAAARGLAPAGVPGSQPSACTTCLHVPAAASRLFEQGGVDELELWVNAEGGHEPIAEEIAASLAQAGVSLTVRVEPFDEFVGAIETGTARLYRYGWSAETPTLDDLVVPLLHSQAQGLGSGNPGGYASAETDALLDEARATRDTPTRTALLQAAEDVGLGRDQAVVPVLFTRHRLVVAERVRGFAVDPTGRVDLTRLALDPADP